MKKIFLVGDSIRMNYDKYVRQALAGEAEVVFPPENARFAVYTYYRLGDWKGELLSDGDPDVVHWNVGLHDVVHLHSEESVTPPEIYGYYLNRICDKLEDLFPHALKIFATTTPIREELYDKVWFVRRNSEIDRLNEVAREVMNRRGYRINDLNALVKAQNPEEVFAEKTHFNFKGSCLLAKAVLETVCPPLGLTFHPERMTDATEERVSEILR